MEKLQIGCLADGRTVYIMPAGALDLAWLAGQFPETRLKRNADVDRDELQYSEPAYRAFLDFLRRDGWEIVGAAATSTYETLTFIRSPRSTRTQPLPPL